MLKLYSHVFKQYAKHNNAVKTFKNSVVLIIEMITIKIPFFGVGSLTIRQFCEFYTLHLSPLQIKALHVCSYLECVGLPQESKCF